MDGFFSVEPEKQMALDVASFPGPRLFTKESYRAWYLKSRDQLTSLSNLKGGCIYLHFTRDFVSTISLWHKWAVKKSYTKSRFATFTRCLTIATVLAHAHKINSPLLVYSRPCARDFRYRAL